MKLEGTCVVITGGAGGIGAALVGGSSPKARATVVVSDRQADVLATTAAEIGAVAEPCDVTDADALRDLIEAVEAEHGPIDLFCSNAGVAIPGLADAPPEAWQLSLDVNLMAHIYAARVLVPRMLERGGGYLLQTASAAGLLTQLGSAPYAVSKHAAVAFAECLSITYGERGVKVSVLAPQAVRTAMTAGTAGWRRGRCRRHARTRRRRGVRRARPRRRALPDPAAPAGARVPPPQDRRLRPLARRDAPPPDALHESRV